MNTNIALNARGVRLPQSNALAPYQQANAMLQLKAQKQQMAQAEQAAQLKNAMLAELGGAQNNDQRAETLMRNGDIEGATKLQKHGSDMKAANRKAMMETHELVGQLASGVTNQAEWDRVAPQIEALTGESLSEAERIFSPGTIDALVNMGISAKDARELDNQDRNYKLNVDKFGETKRHNQATENISKAKQGFGFSVTSPDGTVINYGNGSTPAPKGAQTQLFKDVVGGQSTLDSIAQIEALYEPDFLTYGGALKGNAATFMNKMNPSQRSNFQSRRSAFMSAANREFLAYRKWATGVAGGEKEMAEIKRATFSEDDSPQDFEAKLQLAKSLARRLNARKKAALAAGVENEAAFQDFIKANPLENIPSMQERGDQLMGLGYSEQQVIELLKQEGYY